MIDHTDAGDIPSNGAPEVLHYLHDVLGSVIALTSSNGEVVERYDYHPYGTTYIERPDGSSGWTFEDGQGQRFTTSHYGNPYAWTGQRRDTTTGQYHFWARTYSPHLGRWLQRDPLDYIDGPSLYEGILSDPIGFFDQLGLRGRPSARGGPRPREYHPGPSERIPAEIPQPVNAPDGPEGRYSEGSVNPEWNWINRI